VALAQNGLIAGVRCWLRKNANARFARFMGVSAVALATSLTVLGICDGVLHLTSVPAALFSQVAGALVSYVLSRWAWERKGKPDVLRETIPFWIVFGVATVISTLATKLGYFMARSMHLHAVKQVLFVEVVYLLANIATFLMRFVIFHYILFADRTTGARVTTGAKHKAPKRKAMECKAMEREAIRPDIPATSTYSARPAEAPEAAALNVAAMASATK
jgi:putative flippase GtrA